MKKICELALCFAVIPLMFSLPAVAVSAPQTAAPTAPPSEAPTWTIDQALTCSVSEAWALGGRTEPGFFAIVRALAEISAQKRNITLPDNKEAGHKFGLYIKTHAKADRDQLLYSVVDQAVRLYGTKTTTAVNR